MKTSLFAQKGQIQKEEQIHHKPRKIYKNGKIISDLNTFTIELYYFTIRLKKKRKKIFSKKPNHITFNF